MNIILTGFMATGKSSIGKQLANILGKRYIDVDEIIEKREGRSISQIFAREGEEYFRRVESQVIKEFSGVDGYVISTGGGAVLRKENVQQLRKRGVLICLKAKPEVILERTRDNMERPLLQGAGDKREKIKKLLKKRAPFYSQADIMIDTSSLSVSEAVGKIVKILAPEKLKVRLGERSYPIFIGASIDEIGEIAKDFKIGKKILIISDTNVFPLYGDRVKNSLEEEGYQVRWLQLPPGEKSKSLARARRIYNFCLETELDRTSSILALGGGVVGDVAGFVAATFLRGINFIMVPTTLLSQVDSSVGGKVGVNLPQGKNLVGAFYQPRFVLIDPLVLRTLSFRRMKEGMAEVVKCAIIKNGNFFSYLEGNLAGVMKKDLQTLKTVIATSLRVKIQVVEEDEKEEKGVRQVLNFGHTIAHAIEAVSGFARYTHGEAVAIGMIGAARIGEEMGIFPSTHLERLMKLLRRVKLPTRARGLNPAKILQALKVDKKIREGRLFFVVPQKIGRVHLRDDVPYALVEKVVKELVR